MAITDETMDEAMLCVFSALFAEFEEASTVDPNDVRRAMWPKGVPKVAELIARHCVLTIVGATGADAAIFERIGQALFIQITERQNAADSESERERE